MVPVKVYLVGYAVSLMVMRRRSWGGGRVVVEFVVWFSMLYLGRQGVMSLAKHVRMLSLSLQPSDNHLIPDQCEACESARGDSGLG